MPKRDSDYSTVQVKRGGKTFKRRQPHHHKISKKIMQRELKRLEEQKEVIEENMQKAKRRVKKAIG